MVKMILALAMLMAMPADAAESAVQKIWRHHSLAWTQKDVDAIVSDYSEQAVIVLNGRPYRGKKQIAALYGQLFRIFGRAEEAAVDSTLVLEKMVYITWHAKIDGLSHPVGTDTFFLEKGRIAYQTITSDPGLYAEIQPAGPVSKP